MTNRIRNPVLYPTELRGRESEDNGFARTVQPPPSERCAPIRRARSADWMKRATRGQEFVIGGYIPNGTALDSILVGYYEGRDLMYAASVRAGIPSQFRRVLVPHLEGLRISRCPFANLPETTEGRWDEGLTAAEMAACCWLYPFIVARIEFLEWTPENRFRHPRFARFRSDKDASDMIRE
jgi:ATP-dependent DNA ligase